MSAFEVNLDISGLGAAKLQQAPQRIPAALEAGIRAAGQTFLVASQVAVARIYVRPIPTRAQVAAYRRGHRFGDMGRARGAGRGGEPAWKRTGATRRGVYMAATADSATIGVRGGAAAGISGWPAGYAHRRHQMWVSWQPKEPTLNIRRRDPYFLIASRPEVVFAATRAFAQAFNKTVTT